MTIYTTAEAAKQLNVTPEALRSAAHCGLLRLRQPTPEEQEVLRAAGRIPWRTYGRARVIDAAELERYRAERRPSHRPRRER